MLKKNCPGCSKLIDYADKYCVICTDNYKATNKDYDKRIRHSDINKKYDSFYHSALWTKVRQVAIARDYGLCQDCFKSNTVTLYNTVHHVIPIKADYNKRLNVDNLICLCETCHQRRHSEL